MIAVQVTERPLSRLTTVSCWPPPMPGIMHAEPVARVLRNVAVVVILAIAGGAGTAISASPAPTCPDGPSRNTGAASSASESGAASVADWSTTAMPTVARFGAPPSDWLAHQSVGNATSVSALASRMRRRSGDVSAMFVRRSSRLTQGAARLDEGQSSYPSGRSLTIRTPATTTLSGRPFLAGLHSPGPGRGPGPDVGRSAPAAQPSAKKTAALSVVARAMSATGTSRRSAMNWPTWGTQAGWLGRPR